MKFLKTLAIVLMTVGFASSVYAADSDRYVVKQSKKNYEKTVECVEKNIAELGKGGAQLFNKIDHYENAKKAGGNEAMGKGTLFIFGNPKSGSNLMSKHPLFGIELPLKIYVYEENKKVYVAYIKTTNTAKYHKGSEKVPFVQGSEKMLENIATKATSK